MAITIGELLVINVYAPNDHRDREAFFTQLQAWPRQQQDTILAGDFNCVQSPLLDRLGGHRSKRPESKALEQLLEQGQLEDARILEEHAETEEVEDQDPTEYFTYWVPEAASRIDRYYVPKTWTAVVERVEVEEPAIASDHQRVTLHMREANPAHRKRRRKTGVSYPIKTANPDRVQKEVLAALSNRGVGHEETAKTWDETTAICGECIKQVAQQDQARRKAVIGVLNAQHRAHLLNRKDLLAVTEEDIREAHLVRLGQRLERTMDHMRWEFKRVSNWEKYQTISAIKQMHGEKFRREMNIASKFGSEWKPVLGTAHNAFHGMAFEVEFDKFVTIPN
ncbi:hypothetical protein PF003_g8040 [Phytophthora fragariae]|nr:hypothetical protein PF003_g8040 [Phytophthora fragariae]